MSQKRARYFLGFVLFLALVAFVVYRGVRPRLQASADLQVETTALATPTVAVVHPQTAPDNQELVLPANLQAFSDAPIYARSSGYLKSWSADIGARVHAGQVLAVIETPELDQQLQQARADLATAQANAQLAQITNQRYQHLLTLDGVSKQDADNAAGDLAARQAMVQSAQANVQRVTQLIDFNQVRAPFSGIITARAVDIGSLVDAGSGAHELFHIAATQTLRAYVNFPQDDSVLAHPGLRADLVLPQFPGQRFPAVYASSAGAIDPATRTLLTQFSVPNPTGKLLPGSYCELHLQQAGTQIGLQIPISAILFRAEGPRVVTITGNIAHLHPITLGRDYGSVIQIQTGLVASDWVVTNPPDSITDGVAVHLAAGTGVSN